MITKIYPELSYTVYSRLEEAYYKIGAYSELEMLLRECVQSNPTDGYAKIALAKHLVKKGKTMDAIHELNDAISRDGKFIEARRELGYILLSEDMKDEVEKQYKELIDEVIASKRVFKCESCKHEISDMEWQCPSCLQWDTIKPVLVHS
jgi:lipopolysaccharide biosynthesis regulator YciM